MDEVPAWITVLVQLLAIGVIAALVLGSEWLRKRRPHSFVSRLLTAHPTDRRNGVFKTANKRDKLGNAAAGLTMLVVCLIISVASFLVATRLTPLSRAQFGAQFVGGIAAFLAFLLALGTALEGLKVLLHRPARRSGELHFLRLELAGELEIYVRDAAAGARWPDYGTIRYVDPAIEEVRTVIEARFPFGSRPEREDELEQLRRWAKVLREAASGA